MPFLLIFGVGEESREEAVTETSVRGFAEEFALPADGAMKKRQFLGARPPRHPASRRPTSVTFPLTFGAGEEPGEVDVTGTPVRGFSEEFGLPADGATEKFQCPGHPSKQDRNLCRVVQRTAW